MSLVANSPNLLGIGIDENTAVEIRDDRVMTIVGTGGVFVIDARNAVTDAPDARRGAPLLVSGAVVHSLPTGATFDLRSVTLTRFVERHPDIEVAVASAEGPRRSHPRPGAARGDLTRRLRTLIPTRSPSRGDPVGRRAPHPDRPRSRPTSPSSSRGSTAARTTGPTSRRSTSSSTSGCSRAYPSDTIAGFTDRLVELLPGLKRHACSRGHEGRLRRADARGHLDGPRRRARRAAAGDRGRPRPVARQDPRRQGPARVVYNVIYGYIDEAVGLAAGTLAVRIVNHLVQARGGVRLPRGARRVLPATGASGPPSGRRPRPSSRRRSAATSPRSGSTARRSSSSARASTSSASARR